MTGKRILYLDYARVFTAFLVIYGHLFTPSESNLVRVFIYQFHMPLFFLISGMLHKANGKIQWMKYLRTILIPTLFFVALYAVITFPLYRWGGWFGFKEGVPESLFDGYSTVQSIGNYFKYYFASIIRGKEMLNGPCWFLISLLWCKLLVDAFSINAKSKIIVSLIWIASFLFVVCTNRRPFYLGQAVIAIPYYYLGFACKDKINSFLSSRYRVPSFFISAVVLVAAVFLNGMTSVYAVNFGKLPFPLNLLMYYAAGLSGSFVVIFLSSLIKRESYISKSSKALITILGVQVIFVFVVDNTIGYNLNYFLSILIALLIYVLCVFCHNLIEKYIPFVLRKNTMAAN